MRKLIDTSHPFYRPLWVRIAVTLFCLAWGAFEGVNGNGFWASLFIGLGILCAYEFFIAYKPPASEPEDEDA
ncbi:DUF3329 domain-containing protein [Pseudoruegeria sp. HB172150]|uniref:DUF3329 domain-containing protein n=1 Tax=Pseudoruegeria sp. HB172150 TaxID=2721164 RepID=UPI001552D0C6|nr:DUF3329 domain-containing protein [Pseudoruegeria sp. HB172150]